MYNYSKLYLHTSIISNHKYTVRVVVTGCPDPIFTVRTVHVPSDNLPSLVSVVKADVNDQYMSWVTPTVSSLGSLGRVTLSHGEIELGLT